MRKAFYFTAWVHSLLIWIYTATRIIVDGWYNVLFLDFVPYLTFFYLAMLSFLSSFLFLFLFAREQWS